MPARFTRSALAILAYLGLVANEAERSYRPPAGRRCSLTVDASLAGAFVALCLVTAVVIRPTGGASLPAADAEAAPTARLADASPFHTPTEPTRGELNVIVQALQSDASRMVARRPTDAPAFDALTPAGARVELGGAEPLMRVDDDPAHLRLAITIVGLTGDRMPVWLNLRYEDRWLVDAVILGGVLPARESLQWA